MVMTVLTFLRRDIEKARIDAPYAKGKSIIAVFIALENRARL